MARGERASAPAQGQVHTAFGPLEIENHFFQQCAQELLAVAVGGRRRSPHLTYIGAESLNRLKLRGADCAGALLLSSPQFHLRSSQVAQTVLPFGFQTASDQSIFGLHSSIAALGPLRLVTGALHFQ